MTKLEHRRDCLHDVLDVDALLWSLRQVWCATFARGSADEENWVSFDCLGLEEGTFEARTRSFHNDNKGIEEVRQVETVKENLRCGVKSIAVVVQICTGKRLVVAARFVLPERSRRQHTSCLYFRPMRKLLTIPSMQCTSRPIAKEAFVLWDCHKAVAVHSSLKCSVPVVL